MKIYQLRVQAQYSGKRRQCSHKIRPKSNKNVQNHVINHLSTVLKRNMAFKIMPNLIRQQQEDPNKYSQEIITLFKGGPDKFPKYLDINKQMYQ